MEKVVLSPECQGQGKEWYFKRILSKGTLYVNMCIICLGVWKLLLPEHPILCNVFFQLITLTNVQMVSLPLI